MDLRAEKLDLIQWLAQLSDEKIIQKIKALRNDTSEQEPLSDAHKKILDERLMEHQIETKQGGSWKEVRSRISTHK